MQALRDAARNELDEGASAFVSTLQRVLLNQARTNASGAISPPTPFQRPLERPVARSLIEDLTSDAGNEDGDAKEAEDVSIADDASTLLKMSHFSQRTIFMAL